MRPASRWSSRGCAISAIDRSRRAGTLRRALRVALVVFLLDQATKLFVVEWLDLKRLGAIDVLPPFLNFRMAWNRGINFGLFAGLDLRWALVVLALAISAAVLWWIRRDGAGRAAQIAAGLLVGGALGNVVDRLRYGAVADFLNMSCCGIENPFAFNIADVAVFLGAVGLILFGGGAEPPAGRPRRP